MKIYLVLLHLLYVAAEGFSQGSIGSITWKPYFELGKSLFVYQLGPDCALDGVREKLTGSRYSAQLLYSSAEQVDPNSLEPIPNLPIVTFTGSGFMAFPIKIDVAGTLGGDRINLQFRAWDNRNGTIKSWEEATLDPSIAKGWSKLIPDFQLGGVNADGAPVLAGGLVQPEFTICAIPEPSTLALAGLGVLGLAMCSATSSRHAKAPSGGGSFSEDGLRRTPSQQACEAAFP